MSDRDPHTPWNPSFPVSIRPSEFENLVLAWLRQCNLEEDLGIELTHLGIVEGAGGEYRIDVLARLIIFSGAEVIVLVECKHQKRPVEREDAMVLESKLRDVGAHKGMLVSTSGFQKGAVQFAAARGIATVTVAGREWNYETKGARSGPADPPRWGQTSPYVGIRLTPTKTGVACHTIVSGRVNALIEWLTDDAAIK